MIQRVQSIYLLLGALCLVSLFLFDILRQGDAAAQFAWFTPVLLGLAGLTGVAALVALVWYKNRQQQLRLTVTVKYLTLLLALVLYGGFWMADEFMVADETGILWGRLIPLVLPVLAYVFLFLAERAIRSDIALVRSMDRLR